MDNIKITRKTTESNMVVELDFSPVKPNYREKINTPIPFLSHMIEQIVWRSGINIQVDVKLDKFILYHVVCEDLGIAVGKAVAEYIKRKTDDGVTAYGTGIGVIDEAKADCALSFEFRSYCNICYNGIDVPSESEQMYSEDLETFLEGFAQGANCTLHIDLFKGNNSHHIWEAIFRAFGIALGNALTINPARRGMTSGVAGKIEFVIE